MAVRTTIEIDDDLIPVAKQMARERGTTLGKIVSDLIRKALEPGKTPRTRNGVLLIESDPAKGKPSLALVNRLRDEE